MKNHIFDIKVVIIEDDKEKREELIEILRDIDIKLENIKQSKYAEDGIEIIANELPDVVLLDLKIPYSEESESIKIDNSNKVIKEVERLNAARNQEDASTGILIISASIQDDGLRKNYKHIPEVVDFFDKDEIALDENKFKKEVLRKILQVVERDFRHETKIELKEIRNVKLNKLKEIHIGLYDRIMNDLLGQFEKLNNRNANTYRLAENIIGLSGRIVEDIINLIENNETNLTPLDNSDNFSSIRNKLTELTGRRWDNYTKSYEVISNPIISRKAAEYARFAYQLRSEALHSKEGDDKNKKIYVNDAYTIEDASVSISLIMPLIQEFIIFIKDR